MPLLTTSASKSFHWTNPTILFAFELRRLRRICADNKFLQLGARCVLFPADTNSIVIEIARAYVEISYDGDAFSGTHAHPWTVGLVHGITQ